MRDRIDNLELDIRAKESAQKTLAVAQSTYEIENLKTSLNDETVSIRKQVSALDNDLARVPRAHLLAARAHVLAQNEYHEGLRPPQF